jgi:hypothetical protein
MKHIYTIFLIIFLIFVIFGFSYYKQTQQEGMENMNDTNIDPAPPAIIQRGNSKVRRRRAKRKKTVEPFIEFAILANTITTLFMNIKGVISWVLNFMKFVKIFAIFALLGRWILAFASMAVCAVTKITQFPQCFPWYLLDLVGKVLYFPFYIIIFIFNSFGIREPAMLEKFIWDQLENVDKIIHGAVGLHIIHFPDCINEKCYKCKGMLQFPKKIF